MQVLPLYYFTLVLTVMRTATVLENVCKKFQVFLMQSSFNFPPSSRVSRLRSAIANIVYTAAQCRLFCRWYQFIGVSNKNRAVEVLKPGL